MTTVFSCKLRLLCATVSKRCCKVLSISIDLASYFLPPYMEYLQNSYLLTQ